MRVSDANFLSTFLRGIGASREAQERALGELADGRRVHVASDDPTGVRSSLAYRARLARLDGYERAATAGRIRLETLDVALGSAVSIVTDARAIALAGASGPSSDGNAARAIEVQALRDRLLDLANVRHDDRYLFAGSAIDTRPFDDAGDYFGNAEEVRVPVSDVRTLGITLAGDSVFHGGGNLFVLLDDLAAALSTDDAAAIETAAASLTGEIDRLATARAEVGVRMRTTDASIDAHSDERLRLTLRIAEIENVAVEDVAVRLAAANTSLDALAASAGRVLGSSLFDYLT
jgi:flagellar hook-associated protein 3 FlgL